MVIPYGPVSAYKERALALIMQTYALRLLNRGGRGIRESGKRGMSYTKTFRIKKYTCITENTENKGETARSTLSNNAVFLCVLFVFLCISVFSVIDG
jgi:hypothetical protein